MARFCKEKGFVYADSELYGGLAGFWDFGPLGVELKNNLKAAWWKRFVKNREDVLGMDGSIITHKKIWESSGHVSCFADLMIHCKECKNKFRADHFLEDKLGGSYDGIKAEEVNALIKENKLSCDCNGEFAEVANFNLMFQTHVGPNQDKGNIAYLRPETAQLMFADFMLIYETARAKLPFGIAQQGKMFRNEISPRDFLFRSREFEAMELEFFVHPDKTEECPFYDEIKDVTFQLLSVKDQEGKKEHSTVTFGDLVTMKVCTQWHAYWLAKCYLWFVDLGVRAENLRIREHLPNELAHYAGACLDIEYKFPFGWKEICGNADRKQYDLTQHGNASGKEISIYDDESKQKVIPYVASEPAFGVERAFLTFLFDAYNDDTERGNAVLKLHHSLVPIQVCVFPLVNKLYDDARSVFDSIKEDFVCFFDKSGSVGRRYARADERGVPICITVDFESREDKAVTLRNRDTAEQVRVPIAELSVKISAFFKGEEFSSLGKKV